MGRGPLAGPVVAACVYISPGTLALPFWSAVRDSKQLSDKKRAMLAPLIRAHTIWGMAEASVAEIDTHNILRATFIAMRRAFEKMPTKPHMIHALVDGNRAPTLPVPVMTVIKGDQTSLSIAAASIIAKVARDEMMIKLDAECPGYGWVDNAGYGTAAHLQALQTLGPTPHHRQSFAPVKSLLRG